MTHPNYSALGRGVDFPQRPVEGRRVLRRPSSSAFTKPDHFRGQTQGNCVMPPARTVSPTRRLQEQLAERMTRQVIPNTERDGTSPESDDPSDFCDFGFVLIESRAKVVKNSVAEAPATQQSRRDREYDPADHWGRE